MDKAATEGYKKELGYDDDCLKYQFLDFTRWDVIQHALSDIVPQIFPITSEALI